MIGEVDEYLNVTLYLSEDEIEQLEEDAIGGKILHSSYKLLQNDITLELTEQLDLLNGTTGRRHDQLGEWHFQINRAGWDALEDGKLNHRWDSQGHHATLYNQENLEEWDYDRIEYLTKIRDNPDQLSSTAQETFRFDSEENKLWEDL